MLRRTFVCSYIILFSVVGQLSADKYGYKHIPEVGGWLRLHIIPAPWAQALQRCRLEGGSLASPTTSTMALNMLAMMVEKGKMMDMVYTGINAIIAKGDYTTVEGMPISNISLSWADGEPNNLDNSEDCLVMNVNGELADVNCSRLFRYFCYKKDAKMSSTMCQTWVSDYVLEPRTGSCYKFHTVPVTWNHAALTCRAEQAHLAVINSDTEAQVLQVLFKKHPAATIAQFNRDMVFVGFWDWQKNGEWRTIFGQTLNEAGFGKWGDKEPNNFEGKDYCGTLHRGGMLNDFPCHEKSVFICEITP